MAQLVDRIEVEPRLAQSPIQVRKLGHVVFRVRDVERSTRFYTKIMNFQVSDVNERGMVFFTTCGDHHTIAIMKAEEGEAATQPSSSQLGLSHFAMEVANVHELFAIREFLRREEVEITFEGRKGPGCNIGVEFLDPDGYQVELYCNMDQIGPDGRSRPFAQMRRASSLEEAVANPLALAW